VDRREFHKSVLAGALAAASDSLTGDGATAAAAPLAPALPHPGDALPAGASTRLGTTRFWHIAERGNDGVNDIAFSPDGRTLAALGYQDGCISLWDVPAGRLIRKWDADDADRCGEIVYSPCGRLLAVGSNDGVRVWDPETGKLVRQFADNRTLVHGIAFSPDGTLLAAALSIEGRVDVWALATGELVAAYKSDPHPLHGPNHFMRSDKFHGVAFSPDGRFIGAAGEYSVYHESDGQEEASQLGKRLLDKFRSVSAAGGPDGKWYTEEPRGRVWCWERASGRLLAKLEGHEFPVGKVCFTPGGRLVSRATDGAVWAWDVESGRRVAELAPSAGKTYLSAADFAADGRHALLSRPGVFAVLDLADGRETRRFQVPAQWHGWVPLAISPDLRWAATAPVGRISLYDGLTGANVSPVGRHTRAIDAVCFTPDESRIATITQQEAFLWDRATGQLLDTRTVPDGFFLGNTLRLSPDGRSAACVMRRYVAGGPYTAMTNSLMTWDWQGDSFRVFDDVSAAALAWSADGKAIVVGTEQGEVHILNLGDGRRELWCEGIGAAVGSVAVSPDGRLVAACTGAVVHVGEWSPGRRCTRIDVPAVPRATYRFRPDRVAFSPDGRQMTLSCSDGYFFAGPADGGELSLVFTAPRLRGVYVFHFTSEFLSDGRLLAAASVGGIDEEHSGPETLCVWDVATGRELWASPPNSPRVLSLGLSPDGRTLAAGGWDGTALLWDIGNP
jgi:WD40 repeat protein